MFWFPGDKGPQSTQIIKLHMQRTAVHMHLRLSHVYFHYQRSAAPKHETDTDDDEHKKQIKGEGTRSRAAREWSALCISLSQRDECRPWLNNGAARHSKCVLWINSQRSRYQSNHFGLAVTTSACTSHLNPNCCLYCHPRSLWTLYWRTIGTGIRVESIGPLMELHDNNFWLICSELGWIIITSS